MSTPNKNLPKALTGYLVLIVIALFVGLFFIAGSVYPYQPYTHYGWEIEQEYACPLEALDVTVETSAESGPYTIGTLEGSLYWTDESGTHTADATINQDISPHERQIDLSAVSWVAPIPAAKYRIELVGLLDGRVFGVVPNYQQIEEVSGDYVTVVNDDNGRCKDDVYLPE